MSTRVRLLSVWDSETTVRPINLGHAPNFNSERKMYENSKNSKHSILQCSLLFVLHVFHKAIDIGRSTDPQVSFILHHMYIYRRDDTYRLGQGRSNMAWGPSVSPQAYHKLYYIVRFHLELWLVT